MMPKTYITVGSASVLKISAVKQACKEIGLEAEIQGINVPSGQAAQPIGYESTVSGALTRAGAINRQFPQHIAIGIENGLLVQEAELMVKDIGVVVLLTPQDREIITITRTTDIPIHFYREAKDRGLATTTVGTIIAEQMGGDPCDPHTSITNGKQTRLKLLTEAIVKAFHKSREC
jgi:non-canonical (house-cleaning) NTP pyrophosphatase